MEDPNSTEITPTPGSALAYEEICENATIIDEGIKLCPLCASEVRPFYIHLNEKILMCENVECEYPFGHERIIYVNEDNQVQGQEVVSIRSGTTKESSGATPSMVSTSAWSEYIDNINRQYDAEKQLDHMLERREYYTHRKKSYRNPENEANYKEIFEKVKVIKKLNEELINSDDKTYFAKPKIENEEWIKNLMSKQKESGISLLGPEEMKLFNTKQPDIGPGELKLDIAMGNECEISSVKIDIF